MGNSQEAMKKFMPTDKVEQATNDLKATFKIEIDDHEKANRDKNAQSIYHTGAALIKLEKEDIDEIQGHQLAKIAEEGQRESSDEGDGDEYGNDDEDPDEDLDF